jgi:hypothetical protein
MRKTTEYVNNKRFFDEIVAYQKRVEEAKEKGLDLPRIPDYIGQCVLKIAERLSTKPNFINYSFRDDMIADAVENCFHRDTKILTLEQGPVEIGKLVGQTVTVRSRDGIWRPAKVKSFGKQKLYEYGFGARNKQNKNITQKVIATSNHRWFVQCRLTDKKMFNWKNEVVTDLRIGDMLENAQHKDEKDTRAVVHGLIFGDGSIAKKISYNDSVIQRQGRDYAFMRVCKQDYVRDEIVSLLNESGYKCTYPPSAKGDPVYYFGRFPSCKEVPFTYDPSYISGFIYGWWLADGTKKTRDGMKMISTISEEAAAWLTEHCAYAGYHVLSYRIKHNPNHGFKNSKPLHVITLGHDDYYRPRVKYIKEFGEDEVFCLEEPVTKGFVLANGLLTGNCILYFHDFDPEKSQNPFAYFTQITYYAFIRRINKEEKNRYTIYKNFQETITNTSDSNYLLDGDDNHLISTTMYDNINVFMEKFEKKEEEKRVKRKTIKEGLQKFIEE